jgi:hypothetical protein
VICRFAARNRAAGAVLPISFVAEEHDYRDGDEKAQSVLVTAICRRIIVHNDIVRLAYGRDYEGTIIVRTFGSCAPSRLDSARAPHRPMRVAWDAITKARCLFGSRRVYVCGVVK